VDAHFRSLLVAYDRAMVGQRKASALAAIEEYIGPVVSTPEEILNRVCSVTEYAERTGSYPREVLRSIGRGELWARKSGGTWLIHGEAK